MDTTNALRITLNGAGISTASLTLGELLAEQGYGEVKVATAINGSFVPAKARAATPLNEGDAIEVLSARQGG